MVTSCFPLPTAPGNHRSSCLSLATPSATCEWNHAAFVFFQLAYFTQRVSSSFIYVAVHTRISFLFKAEQLSIVHTDHIWFTHSLTRGQLDWFELLALVNNAAMNTGVQTPVCVFAFSSFGYIPRRGIAGTYSSSIFIFLRITHAVFSSSCNLLRYLQYSDFSGWFHLRHHLLLSGFCFCNGFEGVLLFRAQIRGKGR